MGRIAVVSDVNGEICRVLKEEYKGGCVGIVGKGTDALAALLVKEGFTVEQIDAKETEPSERLRYFVGIGGADNIDAAKRLCNGYPMIAAPERVARNAFHRYYKYGNLICQKKKPETVIISELGRCTDPEFIAAAFNLCTDIADFSLAAGHEEELKIIHSKLIKSLFYPPTLREGLLLIARGEAALEKRNGLCACCAASLINAEKPYGGTFCDFLTSYFINLSLLQFTKCRFNGILLGIDRVPLRNRVPPASRFALPRRSIPYADEEAVRTFLIERVRLTQIALSFRSEGGKRSGALSVDAVISGLSEAWEAADMCGIVSSLICEGFTEGLKDGIKN